jgi:hypothetical protein
MAKYKPGARVILVRAETQQYPERYQGQVLVVTNVYDHYVPASRMHEDPTGHPGYDQAAGGRPLYGTKLESTGEPLPFDLYFWEVTPA